MEKRQVIQDNSVKKELKLEAKKIWRIMDQYGVLLVLFALVIGASFLSDVFLTQANIFNVLRQVSAIGIISIGMTFVIMTGGIDISVGSVVGVISVMFAALYHPSNVINLKWLITPFASIIPAGEYSGILVVVLVLCFYGLILGLLNGVIISKFNIQPFIVTIGTLTIYRGLALVLPDGRPIYTSPEVAQKISFLGDGRVFNIPVPVIIFFLVTIIAYFVLTRTTFGRYVRAIGGNQEAARVAGIKIDRYKISVYAISGLMAALAAILVTSRTTTGEPTLGNSWELDAIAAVVIGGTRLTGGVGTVVGTVVGVIIIGVINNMLNLLNVSAYYQYIIKGLIIVLAVLLRGKRK